MSSNDRIHRLLRLIEILQSGQRYNSSQLATHCDVSRRTIFRDLATLQESGLAVQYDDSHQGYSLPPRTFLRSTDFTLEEALALMVLCRELGDDRRGIPFLRFAQSAGLKIASSLPQQMREYVGDLSTAIAIRLHPAHRQAESQSNYDLLLKALAERRHVRLKYRSFTDRKTISTLLSPFRVLFSRRNWYVVGRSSVHRAIRTFNVQRIQSAEMVDSRYRIPPRFDLDRHLGNAWNLIRDPEQPLDIEIRFSALVAGNVDEVCWHKTQRTEWNEDGTLTFRVHVDGLREIIWWILGYGEHAEVISPPELRGEMQRRITAMRAIYGEPPTHA